MKKIQIITIFAFLSATSHALIWEKTITSYPDGAKKQVEVYHHEIKLNEILFSPKGDTILFKDYFWCTLPFGKWKKYSKNNIVSDSGSFIIGEKESYFIDKKIKGKYCEYYHNGKIKIKTYFKNRFITDEWKSFYENGNVELIGLPENANSFINWVGYDTLGTMLFANKVVDKYEYHWTYDNNGNPKYERIYKDGRRIIYRCYYDNLRIEEEILSPVDTLWMFTYYHSNGIINHLKTEINEHEQGKSISYYENGGIKSTGSMNGFQFAGLWTWYYDNGKIQKQIDFDSLGGLNGRYVEYYRNGKIKTDAHFSQKMLDKDFKEYDEEGKITRLIKCPAQSRLYNFSIGRSGPDKIQLIIKKSEK
ncbi:MAG: hypothetical protein KJ620_02810 [Candidatus Edwardsbacteria bacterium]|nr:hypothetical protein [Candidatus Edwardsbacteria bacterium]MBU1576251.1 hypothetical protein [Candidatus Edwardsbacteria bacterium]MBU2462650.1 hypothetical protein [Candidatus Edwardsbacteria bacterium]MBU2594433.1 hypothetical protein [Candidatus Edwardsbacteria bacterium]